MTTGPGFRARVSTLLTLLLPLVVVTALVGPGRGWCWLHGLCGTAFACVAAVHVVDHWPEVLRHLRRTFEGD